MTIGQPGTKLRACSDTVDVLRKTLDSLFSIQDGMRICIEAEADQASSRTRLEDAIANLQAIEATLCRQQYGFLKEEIR